MFAKKLKILYINYDEYISDYVIAFILSILNILNGAFSLLLALVLFKAIKDFSSLEELTPIYVCSIIFIISFAVFLIISETINKLANLYCSEQVIKVEADSDEWSKLWFIFPLSMNITWLVCILGSLVIDLPIFLIKLIFIGIKFLLSKIEFKKKEKVKDELNWKFLDKEIIRIKFSDIDTINQKEILDFLCNKSFIKINNNLSIEEFIKFVLRYKKYFYIIPKKYIKKKFRFNKDQIKKYQYILDTDLYYFIQYNISYKVLSLSEFCKAFNFENLTKYQKLCKVISRFDKA